MAKSSNKKKRKANHQLVRPENSQNKKSHTGSVSPQPTKNAASTRKPEQPPTIDETLACVSSPWGPIQTPVLSHVLQDVILERFQKELLQRFPCWLNRQDEVVRRQRKRPNSNVKASGDSIPGTLLERIQQQNNANVKSPLTNEEHQIQSILRRRILVGTNQCTRALEAAIQAKLRERMLPSQLEKNDASTNPPTTATTTKTAAPHTPLLIILARDVYPPTMLSHIPVMARQVGTPIALLPRHASKELGNLFHTRRVAIVAFLPCQPQLTAVPQPKVETAEAAAVAIETETKRGEGDSDSWNNVTLSVDAALDSFVDFVQSKLAS